LKKVNGNGNVITLFENKVEAAVKTVNTFNIYNQHSCLCLFVVVNNLFAQTSDQQSGLLFKTLSFSAGT
jgi:hypothetical protein